MYPIAHVGMPDSMIDEFRQLSEAFGFSNSIAP